MSDVQPKLTRWASICSFALGDYFDLYKAHFPVAVGLDEKEQFVLTHLSASCHWTSESALLLVSNVRLWDAEMLIRSVLEGTYKLAFLCVGDSKERSVKLEEYWETMPEMALIKRHKRAQELLAKVDNPQADIWRPIRDLLLKPDEFADLECQYPSRVRQKLEQRWSFSEIAKVLSAPEFSSCGSDALVIMMLGYGMAGHLLHQDADAIGLIWDRNHRDPERLRAIELAHGARELSDLVSLAMLRTFMVFMSWGADTRPIAELATTHREFLGEIGGVAQEWYTIEYGTE